MGLNMLRTIVFITSIVWLAGCTVVIDRGMLESEVSHEEGVKSASIDIVAQCDFGQLSVDASHADFTRSTCVFIEDRLIVYTRGFFNDKLNRQFSIKYADMKSVALYKYRKSSQLQIEGMSGYLALEITTSNGIFIDQEMSERVHKHLLAKGVAEHQSTDFINHSGTIFFLPIPNAIFVPFI
jgi:hypothetical protein